MIHFRQGTIQDLHEIKDLALRSWRAYQQELLPEQWQQLKAGLTNDQTYQELFEKSFCLLCLNEREEVIGMGFLVPSGNPTTIYDASWCAIRFISVDPLYGGRGIGRQLTERCIQYAKENGERTIALHTSEMMANARHIYERLGFKVLREIDRRYGKRYWLYTMDLG